MPEKSRNRLISSLEDRLLVVALLVLFASSILTAAMHISSSWQAPLIFLALLAVIKLVAPVDEIHEDVRYLRGVAEAVRVQRYATMESFYSDLAHAVEEASVSLDLSHIRDQPPAEFRGNRPTEYFNRVMEWTTSGSQRSVRRLISIRNQEMRQWASQLADATSQIPAFRVRVVKWDMDAPAINMAIVDGKAVFLAITGEIVERTKGLGIEDTDVAAYFTDYYNMLWNNSIDLATFLADYEPGAGAAGPQHSGPGAV